MHRSILLAAAIALAACTSGDSADTIQETGLADSTSVEAAATDVGFSYAGLSVPDNFDAIVARFPLSRREGNLLHLSPREATDYITGIGFTSNGSWRKLLISFEVPSQDINPPWYPPCLEIQDSLARHHGIPDSLKLAIVGGAARSDRYWQKGGDSMTLLCVYGASDSIFAEALSIERSR